jgi:hypothetical protein
MPFAARARRMCLREMPSMGSNMLDEAVTYPGSFGNLDTHVLINMKMSKWLNL